MQQRSFVGRGGGGGGGGTAVILELTYLNLTTFEEFTTMVANEDLEKAEPIDPGPPGPTALHPLRRMRCELFQVKHLQEHTYSSFRVELSQLLGESKSPMAMVGFEPATFRLAVKCFNHLATNNVFPSCTSCALSYQRISIMHLLCSLFSTNDF